ncbi:zinc finger protein zpr1 [Pseudovirgaria hyperparasitica]|uniref:Zinc finger protein zpr1 n=1 Tax=Pseudovirgaria hyperparasitica TaxID=470096 RepID=A0A6A6WI40_9PEZI|nr:zinc finger protein zpr1 [Pseudovirgaria hyperparasitica]KAF2761710.1 zinc finger protein zpr1 [Pseudovirgaria hyperparasitica]
MGRKVAEASAQNDIEDGDSKVVDEIESLCMNCKDDGITRLLLTKIPFFREIIIMSFHCDHCHFQNTEVQFAGQIQQRGAKITLKADRPEDLNRQIVKSDTCILRVEDMDLEIPPGRGQLTNIEGILSMISTDLGDKQEERRAQIPEVFERIQTIIRQLDDMSSGKHFPFTISVDDPAGNSYIEPSTSDTAGKFHRREFDRTPEQNAALGLTDTAEPSTTTATETNGAPPTEIRPEYHANQMYPAMPTDGTTAPANVDDAEIVEGEVYSFPSTCPGCTRPCATNMKMVNIPHFKQVVLMSTVCQSCGYRSNEVKTGGEVPPLGRRITLHVRSKEDLSRDILKAESCALSCPELSLQVEPGTLGGRFTTIEGLLTQVRDDLRASIFSDGGGGGGDSMAGPEKEKWDGFFAKLSAAINGEQPFEIILEDPLASSYLQSLADDGMPDAQMTVEDYERTDEELEHLGLNDIKTEGYEGEEVQEVQEAQEVQNDDENDTPKVETNGVNGTS